MSTIVRWGVLGAAKIGWEHLCPAIHLSERGEFYALATRSREKAQPYLDCYPGLTVHGSYEDLLADPEIHAVYIPLPNSMHVEWTRKALDAGKHVLCEKPIALRAAEIDTLIAARDRTGLVAAEAFMVTHHPQWHFVRDQVQSGAIGRLQFVQGAFSFNNAAEPENIRNRDDLGGGALRDIGVYPSVTTRFVTGQEPLNVRSTIEWDRGIDATATVLAQFPDFTLQFYCSMRLGARQEMVFHGDEGFIRVTAPFNAGLYDGETVQIRRDDGTTTTKRFLNSQHYLRQIEAFNRSVLDNDPFPCTLELSRDNQVMIDMIYTAAGGEESGGSS